MQFSSLSYIPFLLPNVFFIILLSDTPICVIPLRRQVLHSHNKIPTYHLPLGATALGEPWPLLQPVSTALSKAGCYVGLLAACPTPNMKD
jgi:hypothetical protein